MRQAVGLRLGVRALTGGRCRFRVWAPAARKVELHILEPGERTVPLARRPGGYFHAIVNDVAPGTVYLYRLDERLERPDPASRSQPGGVHGPSEVVDSRFCWRDAGWSGVPFDRYIIYELHVGTFTSEGTFDAAARHIRALCELGATAVELMPVGQFPGDRNWGYDGVQPFGVQNTYGGPEGLKRLVDACHQAGLAVVLDVVYNHVGPEGNYLSEFGPYFTDRYKTPWGRALNFDGPHSDGVRRFFVENALYWVTEFHADALRLDAVHAIFDRSARPFLQELGQAIHEAARRLDRRIYVVAESDLNDTRLVRSLDEGGYGLDGQWCDDFHHALHALVTGERTGYYEDFGKLRHMATALTDGFVLSGRYSRFRRRRHGHPSPHAPPSRLVVCAQNHDQVGNRMLGEKMSQLVSFEQLKLVAGLVLLSPYIPLIFMGEEYGEIAQFLYFVSHSEPSLIDAVRRGRREESAAFAWQAEPPDSQAPSTFHRSKINQHLRRQGHHRVLLFFYQEVIRLRKSHSAFFGPGRDRHRVILDEDRKIMCVTYAAAGREPFMAFHFAQTEAAAAGWAPPGAWTKILDSADEQWNGPGSTAPGRLPDGRGSRGVLAPQAFVIYQKEAAT